MRIDILLRRLADEQNSLAREALERPQGREAFDYGRVVGMYAGLEQAKTILTELLAEKETKDFYL